MPGTVCSLFGGPVIPRLSPFPPGLPWDPLHTHRLTENYVREVQGVSMGARAGSESGECDTAPMQVQTFFTAAAEMCGGTP